MVLPKRLPHTSYYDPITRRQTAALIRARRPYLVKNAVTGLSLFALTICIYAYTIHAISQDEFEDVIVPDRPARTAPTPNPKTSPIAEGAGSAAAPAGAK